MNIERLKKVAIHHAQRVRTRCVFNRLLDEHTKILDNYVFYAIYECKRNTILKRIVLTEDGNLVEITN